MALILNIETSTNVCSVSIGLNGKTIALKQTFEANSHSKILTVFIQDILKENNIDIKKLDAVAVSKGPGSYTGLRIGVSAAKGIVYGLNIPLISINTLKLLAFQFIEKMPEIKLADNTLLAPMIDARRMEVYTALFDLDLEMKSKISADIIDKESYKEILTENKVYFFGDGALKCNNTIINNNAYFVDDIFPSAESMSIFSERKFTNKIFEDTAYFEPFYLKDFIASIPKKNIYG